MDPTVQRIAGGEPEDRLEAILGMLDVRDPPKAQIDAVVRVLRDDHPGLRQAALEVVGQLAHRGVRFEHTVLERAIALSRDDSPKVRAESASALALVEAEHDHPSRLDALRRLLGDADALVRQEAAAALGDLKDEPSIESLAAALNDADADVRFEAAFALAALRDGRARPILESELRRTKRRLDAMKGLGLLGDPASAPALERYTRGFLTGWADRLTAHATLYLLGRESAVEAVLGRTSARNFQERTYALSLIGSHQMRQGTDHLVRVAEDSRDALRDTAIRALGALGEPSTVPCLVRLAENTDESFELRREATESLRRIPGDDAAEALRTIAARDDALRAVAEREPPA